MKQFVLKSIMLPLILITFISSNAQRVYMKAEGTKTGVIKDLGASSKFADKIELTGYSFEGSSTTQATGGAAAGRRIKSPLIVTKNNGQSSILFFNAQITNEVLKTVVIEVYKTNNQGMEILEETITLTNATVSYFRQSFDSTPANGASKGPADEIRFIYQKINITYANGGVSAEDNWNSN